MQGREHRFGIPRIILDPLVFTVRFTNSAAMSRGSRPSACIVRPQLCAALHASIATTVPPGSVPNHFRNSPFFMIDDHPP